MRYALAVASFLVCWSGGAFGAEMPKDLVGSWCFGKSDGMYVPCKKGEEDLRIERKSTTWIENSCDLLSVSKRGNGTVDASLAATSQNTLTGQKEAPQ